MPAAPDLTSRLVDLVARKALKRGSFRLASGREASFYLDAKQVVLDAEGSMLVGQAILARLAALRAQIVSGAGTVVTAADVDAVVAAGGQIRTSLRKS
jgi:orotate phosphoribosyltransferase